MNRSLVLLEEIRDIYGANQERDFYVLHIPALGYGQQLLPSLWTTHQTSDILREFGLSQYQENIAHMYTLDGDAEWTVLLFFRENQATDAARECCEAYERYVTEHPGLHRIGQTRLFMLITCRGTLNDFQYVETRTYEIFDGSFRMYTTPVHSISRNMRMRIVQ